MNQRKQSMKRYRLADPEITNTVGYASPTNTTTNPSDWNEMVELVKLCRDYRIQLIGYSPFSAFPYLLKPFYDPIVSYVADTRLTRDFLGYSIMKKLKLALEAVEKSEASAAASMGFDVGLDCTAKPIKGSPSLAPVYAPTL